MPKVISIIDHQDTHIPHSGGSVNTVKSVENVENVESGSKPQTTPTATSFDAAVAQAVATLEAGGLLIFPTETTYGAGVDATNPAAVAKLLAYKSRREGKPLSIAVSTPAAADQYVIRSQEARRVYERFLPGPVTVVSHVKDTTNAAAGLAAGVASEFGTVGIRISSHPFVEALTQAFGKPITATSANGSGKKRPYSIDDLMPHLSKKHQSLIDCIVDAGTLPPNEPSIVIDTTLSTPITLRNSTAPETASLIALVSQKPNFMSQSEADTRGFAGRFALKHWNTIRETGLIIGLDGALGTGKTIFTKGIADFLHITEPITSPTYSYMNEYAFERHGVTGTLYHLDVWKIDSAELANRLELPKLVQPNTIMIIEWWSQIRSWVSFEKQPIEIMISEVEQNKQKAKNQPSEPYGETATGIMTMESTTQRYIHVTE